MAAQRPLGQPPELTPQSVQTGILQMKKALSSIEGECATMRSDAQSKIFENMLAVCGRLIQQSESLKKANLEYAGVLEKIYQAHPEIKIATEKDKKSKTKDAQPTVKVVSKKS